MFSQLRALSFVLCLPCFGIGALPALAVTWQEERDAGVLAFSNADYAEAAERLERAFAAAREGQASPEELGAILEKLTTAHFAVRRFRRARDSIVQWDAILDASAGEAWVEDQRTDRDVLAVLISEVLRESEPELASPERLSDPDSAGAPPADPAEAYTPDAEADTPFEPDEPIDMPVDEPSETAALPPSSGRSAIHLLSLKDLEAVEASWEKLRESHPDLLADKDFEVRRVELEDQGIYYRLYAVPFADAAAAASACEAFEKVQQYCAVATVE